MGLSHTTTNKPGPGVERRASQDIESFQIFKRGNCWLNLSFRDVHTKEVVDHGQASPQKYRNSVFVDIATNTYANLANYTSLQVMNKNRGNHTKEVAAYITLS